MPKRIILRCWLEGNLFGHGKHVTGCDRSVFSTIGSQFPGDLWISHRSKELCWPRAFQGRACRAPLGFSGGPKKPVFFRANSIGEPSSSSSSHMISRKMTLFLGGGGTGHSSFCPWNHKTRSEAESS